MKRRHGHLFWSGFYVAIAILIVVAAISTYISGDYWALPKLERLGLGLSILGALCFYLAKAKDAWDARKLETLMASLHPRIHERGADTIIVETEDDRR